jgi:catecholate siderophore receptor
MMNIRRFTLVGGLVAAAGWYMASGQTTETAKGVEELPEMVVTAPTGPRLTPADAHLSLGISADALRLPISASAIDERLNIDQGNRTLRDTLRNVPGVLTGTGNGIHDFFVVRGVDSLNGSLVLMDGLAEPEATFYTLYDVAEVQVLKGPGSFRFGPNALASSVNLVRKGPRDDGFADVRLGLGSHETVRLFFDGNGGLPNAPVDGRLNLFYEQGESHRDLVDHTFYGVSPSAAWQITEADRLSFWFDYQDYEITPDAGVPVLGDTLVLDSKSVTFQEPDDFSEQEVVRAVLVYEHAFNPDVDLRNRTYFTGLDWASRGTVYAGFVAFGQGLEPQPLTLSRYRPTLDDRQERLGNELELAARFATGSVRHDSRVGVDLLRATDDFLIEAPTAPNVNIATGMQSPAFLPDQPVNQGDARTDRLGLYGLDQLQLAAAWSVLVGARVDWLDFEDKERGSERSDTLFSPFGGLVYQPAAAVSLFANVGRGYGLPSTQVVGPRGEPEESRQAEAGAKWRSDDLGWYGQVSAFYLERENVAIPTSAGIFSENGSQVAQGVEVELAGEPRDGLRLRLAYGYLDSELDTFTEQMGPVVVDRSGNTAPLSPEHTVQFWSEFDLPGGWGLGLGLRGVSDFYIAPDNVYQVDGYVTADGAVFYRRDSWWGALHVYNMTDETYYGRGTGSTSVIPEDGVSVLAEVGVRL